MLGLDVSLNKAVKPTSVSGVFTSPLAESLPFEEILEDGTIIYADGSLGCGFRIRPVYLDSMTDAACEDLENRLCAVFSTFDGRQDLSFQVLWCKTRNTKTIDAVSRGVVSRDEGARRLAGAKVAFWRKKMFGDANGVYQLDSYIFIRRRFDRKFPMYKTGVSMNPEQMAEEHDRYASALNSDVSRLVRSLDMLKPVALNGQETFALMYESIFGEQCKYEYERFRCPARNWFSGRDVDMVRKFGYLTLGDGSRNVAVMSMHVPPDMSWMRLLTSVAVVDAPLRISMYVTPTSTAAMKRQMEIKLRRAINYAHIFSARSQKIAAELQDTAADLENGSKLFDVELYVAVDGRSARSLADSTAMVRSAGLEVGMELVVEQIGLWPCWLETIPGMCAPYRTDRNHLVKTENVVNIAPFFGGRASDKNGAFLLRGPASSVVAYDVFSEDLAANHGLIFGSTGSGKSFFTSMMILSVVPKDPLVFIVDKGGSYKRLASLLNGRYIDVSCGTTSFNPLEMPPDETSESRKPFIASVLRIMCEEDGNPLSAYEKVLIERCTTEIIKIYEQNKEKNQDVIITLSDAHNLLKTHKLYDHENEAHLAESQNRITTLLGRWTKSGTRGTSWHSRMFDCPKTNVNIQDASMVVFDVNGIEAYPEIMRVTFRIISDLVKRRSEKNKDVKKLIIFDEVWSVLKTEEGCIFLEELYRTMRKYNAAVFSISQDITDFSDSNISKAIMSNCYNKIIMRQSSDVSKDEIKKLLGMNEAEMWLLGKLNSRKGEFSEVLLATGNDAEKRAVKVGVYPSPEELWMATTNANDVALFDSVVKSGIRPLEAVFKLAKEHPNGANK